jgi:hypothetical protein
MRAKITNIERFTYLDKVLIKLISHYKWYFG